MVFYSCPYALAGWCVLQRARKIVLGDKWSEILECKMKVRMGKEWKQNSTGDDGWWVEVSFKGKGKVQVLHNPKTNREILHWLEEEAEAIQGKNESILEYCHISSWHPVWASHGHLIPTIKEMLRTQWSSPIWIEYIVLRSFSRRNHQAFLAPKWQAGVPHLPLFLQFILMLKTLIIWVFSQDQNMHKEESL